MSIIEVFKDFTWKRTLFLSLVAFVLSFPALDLFVNDDPDGVLALLFNRLVADPNADFGPFIFPHGPLAFLLHPLDTGYNLYFFLSFVFLSKLSVIWSLSYFLEKGSLDFTKGLRITFIALLVFLVPSQQLIYLAVVSAAAAFINHSNSKLLVVFSLWTGLSLLIKTDLAVYALISFGVVAWCLAQIRDWKALIFATGVIIGVVILFWTLLFGFGSWYELPGYVIGNYHLLFANEGAMTLVEDNWFWLGVALFLIATSALLVATKSISKLTWVLLFIPLLASWKHGIVRHDVHHAWAFFFHVLTFWVFVTLTTKRFVIASSLVGAISLVAFYMAFSLSLPNFGDRSLLRNGPQCYETAFRQYEPLDLSGYKITGLDSSSTIDVLPYNFFYASLSGADFRPKPVVQSYAANSDYLDDLNAIYFSVNGPEYLIWHANRNGVFESIDGRSSFSDAPHSTQAIFSNYELDRVESNALLFKRKAFNPMSRESLDSTLYSQGEWINVDSANWCTMSSFLSYKSVAAKLEALALRGRPVYINLLTKTGDQHMIRLPRTLSNADIPINPLVSIEQSNVLGLSPIQAVRLIFDTNFYEARFDFRSYRFMQHPLLAEKRIEPTSVTIASLEAEQVIVPGDFSPSITIDHDSTWAKDVESTSRFHVFAHAMVQHESTPNAQLVLELYSNEGHRTEVAYINTPMTAVDGLRFARIKTDLSLSELETITSIKCYVWNASELKPIGLEALTLGIEKMD